MNKKLVIQAMLVLIAIVILSLAFISCIKIYSNYIQWLFDITSKNEKEVATLAGFMLSMLSLGIPLTFVAGKIFMEE